MGYLFLTCALMVGLTKGFYGKKTSSFVLEYKDAVFSRNPLNTAVLGKEKQA